MAQGGTQEGTQAETAGGVVEISRFPIAFLLFRSIASYIHIVSTALYRSLLLLLSRFHFIIEIIFHMFYDAPTYQFLQYSVKVMTA